MVEISVVVPVYNSEDNLAELNQQIIAALAGRFSFELVLVNDQSRDGSWDVIARLAKEYAHVVGVNLRKNTGQDSALMCGLAHATGLYCVIMDDDLQHSPGDIPLLHATCKNKNFDVCYAQYSVKKQKLWKNAGSWFNGKMAELVIGKPADLYLSPFKIITCDIAREIMNYRGPFPYVDGLIFSVTCNIGQTQVEHHNRFRGKSNYNLVRSLQVWLKVATGFSVIPLRISSCIGMVSAVSGFVLAFYFLLVHLWGSRHVEGWTTLTVLLLIIGGLILFSVGVVGEYLGRAYLHLSGKPQYIVREVCRGKL